jgi:VWFA-related protein
MTKAVSVICLLIFSAVFGLAQTPTPTPVDDESVIVISTTLIQIDVGVTDKNGKIVTDLKPDDFEIFENGKKQVITNFSFVTSVPKANAETPQKPAKNEVGAPILPVQIRPEQVRRTIALVVDDLGLSYESSHSVQRALKKFVDEQMQPNDLVAIMRTGSGMGALQQFTSDRNLLYAAIEKVRWNPIGRAGISAFTPIEPTLQEQVQATSAIPRTDGSIMDDAVQAEKDRITIFNEFREDIFSVGTLGAINFVIKGMSELPGRKSIMLFSDGFSICTKTDIKKDAGRCTSMREALQRLTDLSNRSAVTIYTQDAKGLSFSGLTAQDSPATSPKSLLEGLNNRTDEIQDKQDGLSFLARETGGRAVFNTNDLNKGLEKMLEDTKGYYLIGYQPDSETFDSKTRRFNKLTVNVKQDGLNVRYRSGFFGITDSDVRRSDPEKETPLQQIVKPLSSPFAANEVNLKLNPIFGNDSKTGAFVHSFLHIDANGLTFADAVNNSKQATFDVLAIIYGENGKIVDQVGKNYTITVKKEDFQNSLKDGFVYSFIFPVKKPGAYQMRVAIRDAASAKVGSASQFIEIPDLKKDGITLSGIVLENLTEAQWKAQNSTTVVTQSQANLLQDTSLRIFKRGTILNFSAEIYNAKVDRTKKPQLETKIRIFRGEKLVMDGKQTTFDARGQNETARLNYAGAIALGNEMKPGDYVLQLIVVDKLAKGKRSVASQWVQFEITD